MGVPPASADLFLGGRVRLSQPLHGFRSGLDAVMLAAAVPAEAGQQVLELGCGAGAAALCLAARVPGATVHGLECDPDLAAMATANAIANGMAGRVDILAGDVFAMPAALRREFDHVMTNPPFHDREGQVSPDAGRAAARHDDGRLGDWLKAGFRRTASNGCFTAILRADRLGDALAALPHRGALVLPLWPKRGVEAKRVILQLRKGARRPLGFLPGLVLHEADGRNTAEAEAILREGRALPLSPSTPGLSGRPG